MSAIIATALVTMNPDTSHININVMQLELPENVKRNLKQTLRPYLEALSVQGYETKKRRKCFVIGNTGRQSDSL